MTKAEIITTLAEEKVVEEICMNVAHERSMTADLKDLVQVVYLALLEYAEEKVLSMWQGGALRFFITRVVLNQYRSSNSPFHNQVRGFRSRSVELNPQAFYAGAVCDAWQQQR